MSPCQTAPVCPVHLSIRLPSVWFFIDGGNTSESRPRIGGGGSNRLLEHRFKPSPSGRTLSFGCFAYFSYYISQVKSTSMIRNKPKILVPNLFRVTLPRCIWRVRNLNSYHRLLDELLHASLLQLPFGFSNAQALVELPNHLSVLLHLLLVPYARSHD